MDIITQRFMAICNKILAGIHALRADIQQLISSIRDKDESERQQERERQSEKSDIANRILAAEHDIGEHKQREDRTYRNLNLGIQMALAASTALAFIAAAIYAAFAYGQWQTMNQTLGEIEQQTKAVVEANNINRTASAVSQRAYLIYPAPPQIQRGIDKNTGNRNWIILPSIQNGGNTPAFNVIKRLSNNGPEFKALPKHFKYRERPWGDSLFPNMTAGQSGPVIVGAHGDTSGGALSMAESVLQGVNTGSTHVFLWGWTTYSDVFACSHKTEFCWQVVAFATDGVLGTLGITECPARNCADKDCSDWEPTNTPVCRLENEPLAEPTK